MTLASCLVVTAIVWTISLIRSVHLRAFVYSLPIPMTLVLLLTPVVVGGAQLLGVVLLGLFFAVVALLHHRYRWNILLADAAGIALYVLLGAGLAYADAWPLGPTLAAVVAAWVVANIVMAPRSRPPDASPATTEDPGQPRPVKLMIALFGSLVTTGLGRVLGGLVVTFPYAGILVAVESRADLLQFARHFVRNSLGLIAFLIMYALLQDTAKGIAIAGAWTAFLSCSLLLNLGRIRTRQLT